MENINCLVKEAALTNKLWTECDEAERVVLNPEIEKWISSESEIPGSGFLGRLVPEILRHGVVSNETTAPDLTLNVIVGANIVTQHHDLSLVQPPFVR